MSGENIFDILKRYNLGTGLDYVLYEEFSKTIKKEKEIINKIIEYKNYTENNNNKYSEKIMKYLRQREGLNEYDFSNDEEINKISPNEAFDNVAEWKLGSYSDTIKSWVKEIYGVDLNEMESLEKQIPKRPTEIQKSSDIEWLCPVCKSKVGDCVNVDNYCRKCGQKILFN